MKKKTIDLAKVPAVKQHCDRCGQPLLTGTFLDLEGIPPKFLAPCPYCKYRNLWDVDKKAAKKIKKAVAKALKKNKKKRNRNAKQPNVKQQLK